MLKTPKQGILLFQCYQMKITEQNHNEIFQGVSLLGSLGNIEVFRMLSNPR